MGEPIHEASHPAGILREAQKGADQSTQQDDFRASGILEHFDQGVDRADERADWLEPEQDRVAEPDAGKKRDVDLAGEDREGQGEHRRQDGKKAVFGHLVFTARDHEILQTPVVEIASRIFEHEIECERHVGLRVVRGHVRRDDEVGSFP